ncbi:hypothetical protein [Fodinicola acaciae]|uniref:hypothetical protein n=1 Tax=Fodinicola acaciae TaxID=2681555 RepID=UPI0013D85E41|nr:hypothetical protein [Fodinicola acaciae]
MSLRHWGATPDEIARSYFADSALPGSVTLLTRAVTVAAPASLGYRWLCQIAVAPYSYDFIDNWGRRSPHALTPGADDLFVGKRVQIFDLVDVQPGHEFTGRTIPSAERFFGPVALTYAAEPLDSGRCRLIGRLAVGVAGWVERVRAEVLGIGDLVMMRKQLLNLKEYAERDARAGVEL